VSSYCEQCGASLGEGAKFCAACGTQLVGSTPALGEGIQPPVTATRPKPDGGGNWWSRQSKIIKTGVIMGAGFVLLLIIAGFTGGNNGKTDQASDSNPSITTAVATTPAPTPKPTPSTPKQRVREAVGDSVEAGGYAGTLKIKQVWFSRTTAGVVSETPQGGFNGPSCGDLDAGAQAIFQKIYDGTRWRGAATIDYRGGLVSKTTGKPVDAVTGSFGINPAQAKRINWSNSDQLSNIDWSVYRFFCHPALH
jgi:zinc-ribbon domain